MSLQIFLHGKTIGTEQFLRDASADLAGRAQWATLIGEVLPRALLAELRLSPMLLGASGGGHFLLVLPQEMEGEAESFCGRVSDALLARTGGVVSLVWAITENLGDWSDIRKRLLNELYRAINTPAAAAGHDFFGTSPQSEEAIESFACDFREPMHIGWSPDQPAELLVDGGKHRWQLGQDIPFARHVAPNDDESGAATPETLASRAQGQPVWGILRAEVDDFEGRLHRAQTAEEHLQLSMMYKQFFIGELQMRCSLPEFWRKVTLLRADGAEFTVLGSWDALMLLARETWRLFSLFADANLREYAGGEGKSMSLAITLAAGEGATVESVYSTAGDRLRAAAAVGRDSIWVLGRILDARQFTDAGESRLTMTRLIREFDVPPQLLDELAAFYRDASDTIVTLGTRGANTRVDRPWRFYRRLNSMLRSQSRNREFARLRADLIADFTGRRASAVRLRPHGRVALEWAKLETGEA